VQQVDLVARTSPKTSQTSRFACHFQEMSVWPDIIELKIKRSFCLTTLGDIPRDRLAHPSRAPIRSSRDPSREVTAHMSTIAARARILAAFTAGQGYSADADYSPTSWLVHRTGITKGAARGHVGWARRTLTHPAVIAALAEGTVVSESVAWLICGWTDKLPAACRGAADEILLGAAGEGLGKADLAALAAEIYARSLPDAPDDDLLPNFEDRRVRTQTTFGGAGVITGDLTPECAAVVTTVLDALSAPAGSEDTRTKDQRYHDALHDAMRRLVTAGLLPDRAGQPVKVWAHVSLAELRALDDGSVLQTEWIGEMAIRWAARRAAASQTGSDGSAWLNGQAAGAVSCDATLIPVVTGDIDPAALDDLVALCLHYAGHSPHCGAGHHTSPQPPPTDQALEMLRHAIIAKAVSLVSGPGGLASFRPPRVNPCSAESAPGGVTMGKWGMRTV
jgi:hypothetical protein